MASADFLNAQGNGAVVKRATRGSGRVQSTIDPMQPL